MKAGILGRKVGMTQVFDATGERVPVTVLEASPNTVVAIRQPAKDGYAAVQLGFEERKEKHLTRPMKIAFEKAGVPAARVLREFRVDSSELDGLEVGATVDVGIFAAGMRVDVTSTSKGKGFQGVMKRHHMKGMRMTHGTHHVKRSPGSIGNATSPGRVMKNRRMPGQMGNKRVTTQNLKVVEVDAKNGLILVKGTVPGGRKSLVTIRRAVKGQPAAIKAES